ncbi:alpha/beta fold hydrolase [Pseudogemmobacter sp. W21_MBD1_M6]|uniref:alpha/beta fold hydrolase n=1 Tax=Pseudogemmobacter sp. W21_MBD1_M6 TaxID=3240271 RepID=UPI003F9BBBDE
MTDIHTLYEDGALMLRYMPGTSRHMVVSFSGVGNSRKEVQPAEFPGAASNNGENHVLFVTDIRRSWLNRDGLAELLVRYIEATARQIGAETVTALGNSMGGTMALHLSRLTQFDRVIAFVPQFSVDPRIVPQETRWMYHRKRIEVMRFNRVENLRQAGTSYVILHGGSEDELIHATQFPEGPNIHHYIFPDHGHNLARDLKKRSALSDVIGLAIADRPWRLRRRITALGGLLRQAVDTAQAA